MGLLLNTEKRSTDHQVTDLIDIISFNDNSILSNFSGETALLQSDIFTAVRIIAGDLASAEMKVQDNAFVYDLLNKKANNSTTAYNLKFGLIANMLLSNNGFAHIERNNTGVVTGLRLLKSSQVTILESDDERDLGYRVMFANGTKDIKYEDMIHLKAFSLDGKVGISPLYSLKSELSMLKNGNGLLASFFKRGVNVGGVLKLKDGTLNNSQKKQIRSQFEAANSGADNAGSVMILDSTQDYTSLEVNYEVLKMIQNNKYSTQQISKTFGIPLSRFGQELVNSSDTEANDLYITSTLHSYETMLRSEFLKLGVDVDLDFSFLKGNDAETIIFEAIKKNGGSGILTVNEVRKRLGLPNVEDGDKIMINSANVPLSHIDQSVS